MLHQNSQKPAKPPIAAKPKITQKTNVVIVGKSELQTRNGTKANNINSSYADNQPLLSAKDVNHITLPSSPPNYSDFANDCCGILNNKQLDCIQRQKNKKNGIFSNGTATDEENGSSFHHNNDSHKSVADKSFKTSSQSFDSLSSSSGGFRDVDYVTKTRVAYEIYDREENYSASAIQMPIGNSKVQEMKSKLLAQQLHQQQNHSSNEPSKPISRQQIQKSSKELEKVLGLRIQHAPVNSSSQEKLVKRLSKSFDDAQDSNVASISSQIGANISKHIQQKLTEEMKQQCVMIKEKFLIEKIPVQLHYKDFTVR